MLLIWNNNLQDKMLSEKKPSPFSMIHLWKRKVEKKMFTVYNQKFIQKMYDVPER